MEFSIIALVICATMATLPPKVDGWWFLTRKVCYHQYGLGCYSNKRPFNNAFKLLPQSPGDKKVKFYLYTRTNPTSKQILTTSATSIKGSNFDGSKGTKFIIHGYLDNGDAYWINEMRDAILGLEDANFLSVDWREGANIPINYFQPVANTRVVGDLLGLLITEMIDCCGLNSSDVHLIGHSLGAHAAGYAGTFVEGRKNTKVGKLTGLDPAGPQFEGRPEIVRLDPSDASLVDVIHTDADDFWKTISVGARQRLGHLDFYPNGGASQPGCDKFEIGCDHSRADKFYLESIKSSCQFKAYPCANKEDYFAGRCTSCGSGCAYMGYQAPSSQPHGKYYLKTRAESPFCID